MDALSSPLLLVLFVASAGVIWIAGIKLSDNTDVLAERLHLGSALGGLILLAIATNLPEIAIAASLVLVLEGALVVIVLAVVVMGTQLSPNLVFARLAPASMVIAALWVVG